MMSKEQKAAFLYVMKRAGQSIGKQLLLLPALPVDLAPQSTVFASISRQPKFWIA